MKATGTEFVIVIPSYRRVEMLGQRTLATLARLGVPPDMVYIFVADRAEHAAYAAAYGGQGYHIITGVRGLIPQRMFIRRYFPAGTALLSFDDDVESIDELVDARHLRPFRPRGGFVAWVNGVFQRLRRDGIFLWGVYPVRNPYFMKRTETTSLQFIVGTMHGYITRPGLRTLDLHTESLHKDDVENTILHYLQDGAVLRFNWLTIKTRYYSNTGGIQALVDDEQRRRDSLSSALFLHRTYPELTSLQLNKANGHANVRLRDKRFTRPSRRSSRRSERQ